MGPIRIFQVQAQLTATTRDGWESSRQCPTMLIGAEYASDALRAVSDMAWDLSGQEYLRPRRTFGTVTEVDSQTWEPMGEVVFGRVAYGMYGIETRMAGTYAEIAGLDQ